MPKGNDGRLLWRNVLPLLACLLAALATTAAAGCGDSGDSDSSATVPRARRVVQVQSVRQDRWTYARARFNEICAGCHTFADAGARGRRINLDASAGLDETHVRYTIAQGEPGMPAFKDILSEREFEELVAYVSTASAYTGGDDGWLGQLKLRDEGIGWTKADTERLEAYARRIAREGKRRLVERLSREDARNREG
jgi:mono/diheme cytochrome c family protein